MLKTSRSDDRADAVAGLRRQAQEPRRGGTIRFTAPYAASLRRAMTAMSRTRSRTRSTATRCTARSTNGTPTTTSRCWSSPRASASRADGLVHTFKLRDDALFHNGRKMTADDIIWSFTRLMDASKSYPGARYVRRIKGAIEVQKGEAKEISGLKKIDDFTLEMTLIEKADPGFLFYHRARPRSIRPRRLQEDGFFNKPIGLGPFKFVEHVPGSRMVLERWEKFYQPGKPYADRLVISPMGEACGPRHRLPQQGDRRLDPRARRSMSPTGRCEPERASSRSPKSSPATWA